MVLPLTFLGDDMRQMLFAIFNHRKAGPTTLRDGFQRYLKEVTPNKKNAIRQDASIARVWLATEYADWPMVKISGEHIAKQRDSWLEEYKPATVVRRLAILSHLYNTARVEWSHRDLENPVKMIRKPKVRNSRKRRIFRDIQLAGHPNNELDWLIRSLPSRHIYAAFKLAAETGMRRSEIADLLWENINLEAKTAFLPDTKNGHDRTVPLSPAAIGVFESLHREGICGPVFSCTADYFTRLFVKSVKRARAHYLAVCEEQGVEQDPKHFANLRFHDLRHEAISTLAPHFHAHELAKISGHRDTRMLMRYYHPDPSELANRMAAI